MPKRLSLRGRILLILSILGFITVFGGLAMVWYTYQMESLFTQSVKNEMMQLLAVEDFLQELVKLKGFVSYYFMDGDVKWLTRLKEQRQAFRERLANARRLTSTAEGRDALQRIESKYNQYIELKDRVIALYKSGKREEGYVLHQGVREYFDEMLELCQAYKAMHTRRLRKMQMESRDQASRMRSIAATVILSAVLLSLLLCLILLFQIFGPLRLLLMEAERSGGSASAGNEMEALSHEVRGLIEDADRTQEQLEKSRSRLLRAEKMATVGQLAAGVAHSIRNPLTSIKMRLFSIERSMDLPPNQKEDLEVISEETRHIDVIVRNFLEYARPSMLKMQKISPSELIDMNLKLLRHRFKSYGMHVALRRSEPLPEILADPDQLKEVFVNILINACEATREGGVISIEEELAELQPLGLVAVIRIRDNGPGVPAELQEKVFEPFFTTKEEGTGLGLSIAVKIIERHGGLLSLESEEGLGTTFIITLPCREDKSWPQS